MTLPQPLLAARWAVTLALGALGGALALWIGAPLPWLLGGLAATGLAASAGLRILGAPPTFPMRLRSLFIPVIGVLIGAAMTPEVLRAAPGWWPGLASVALFVVVAHALNYQWLRRVGGLSKPTAFFAGMPGGLIESLEQGERHGADMAALTVLQFARIAITVTVTPLAFSLIEGRALGSAAGASLARGAMSAGDAAVMIAAGAAGYFGGRLLRLPAAQILGPILASGAVHALGWTDAAPPAWLAALAQLVIGVTLGLRFVGVAPRALARCFALSAGSVALMLGVGAALSLALAATGLAPFKVMLLAYAPGGVIEMGLIALSLNASPIFVTAHHLVRIVVTVLAAAVGWRRIGAL